MMRFKAMRQDAILPTRASEFACGYDLYAWEDVSIRSGHWGMIPTGVGVELPVSCVGLVCCRSGLAKNHGLQVLNTPGVIDVDYRGEIMVMLMNHSSENYIVKKGNRIAQLVVVRCEMSDPIWIDDWSQTARGRAGLGSTGK